MGLLMILVLAFSHVRSRGHVLLLMMILCGSSTTTAWLPGGGRWSKRRREFSLASAPQHVRQSTAQEDQRHGRNLVANAVDGAAPRVCSHAPVCGHACARHGARTRTRARGPHARSAPNDAWSTAWRPGPDGAWNGDGNAHVLSRSASARLSGAAAIRCRSLLTSPTRARWRPLIEQNARCLENEAHSIGRTRRHAADWS